MVSRCLGPGAQTSRDPAHHHLPGDSHLSLKFQVEYQIRDRLSFMRFLGLGLEDTVPDATTVWLFREALAKAGLVKPLFERFNQHLDAKGYIARGGQIVDATIVNAPKQHN